MPKNPLILGRVMAPVGAVQVATGDTIDANPFYFGIITTKSLNTAAGADYTITINNAVAKYQQNLVFTGNVAAISGTGSPVVTSANVTADGVIEITFTNVHATDALDSPVLFAYWLLG